MGSVSTEILAVFSLVEQVLVTGVNAASSLEAGQPVTSPAVQVGTVNGKPLKATVTLQVAE